MTQPTQPTSAHIPQSWQTDVSMLTTSWLVIVIWHDFCGLFYLFIYFFRLCFPLRFLSSPLTPSVGVFPVVWKFLLLHDAIPRMGHCPQIHCLSFCLYLSSYLIPKRLLCLSGYLVSSASVQKLFCGSCTTCRWSFDVFVKEKMVSQSYSFTILDPSSGLVLLSVCCKYLHPGFCFFFFFCMDYLFAYPHFQSFFFFFCLYI